MIRLLRVILRALCTGQDLDKLNIHLYIPSIELTIPSFPFSLGCPEFSVEMRVFLVLVVSLCLSCELRHVLSARHHL